MPEAQLPACPARLCPLKLQLERALAAPSPARGRPILEAAGLGTGAAAWACLCVLVAVYFPHVEQLDGLDLAVRRRGDGYVATWIRQGQLANLRMTSGIGAPAIVQHVARSLRASPDQRARYASRLLADANLLLGRR